MRGSEVSGHLRQRELKQGLTWYSEIRLPGGREQKAIGLVWNQRSRPPAGYLTEQQATAKLEDRLAEIRRGIGALPPDTSAVTFRDVAEAWHSHGCRIGFKRGRWKPATQRDYRSALDVWILPELGDDLLGGVDEKRLRRWREKLMTRDEDPLPLRQAEKVSMIVHAILEHAYEEYEITRLNPAKRLPKIKLPYNPDDFDFYSPEEILALVRYCDLHDAAQDGTFYMTAAYTGGRLGEILALDVRDVDFEAMVVRFVRQADEAEGDASTKGGRGRSVPMVPELAQRLARHLQRETHTGPFDSLFIGELGGELDRSALRRRYKKAQAAARLRPIRLHDLRHTFGSLAARELSDNDLQALLGHKDKRTTQRYTHYRPRPEISEKLARTFAVKPDAAEPIDLEQLADVPVEILMKALQDRLS